MAKLHIDVRRCREGADRLVGGDKKRSDVTVRLSAADMQRLEDACMGVGDVRVPVMLARARHSVEADRRGHTVHQLTWSHVRWDESIFEVRVILGLLRILGNACRIEKRESGPYVVKAQKPNEYGARFEYRSAGF